MEENLQVKITVIQKDIEQLKAVFQKDIEQLKIESKKHDKILTTIQDLTLQMSELTQEMKHQRDDITRMEADLAEVKSQPTKHWNGLVTTSISVIVTALVTFVLVKLGLKS